MNMQLEDLRKSHAIDLTSQIKSVFGVISLVMPHRLASYEVMLWTPRRWIILKLLHANLPKRSSHRVVINVQDCDIVVNEFELQLRYYVYFRTNALWETTYETLYLPCWGIVLLMSKDDFGIKSSSKVDMPLNKLNYTSPKNS